MRIIILLLVLCPFTSGAQFRGLDWGAPKGVVRQAESGSYPRESKGDDTDLLVYFDKSLSTYDVTIVYSFVNDSLDGGMYIINNQYVNKNKYIVAFDNLKSQLITKYGNPLTDDILWHNRLYKDRREDYGLAVSAGHLQYKAYWIIDDKTSITLNLSGENFECNLGIMYNDYERVKNSEIKPARGL